MNRITSVNGICSKDSIHSTSINGIVIVAFIVFIVSKELYNSIVSIDSFSVTSINSSNSASVNSIPRMNRIHSMLA